MQIEQKNRIYIFLSLAVFFATGNLCLAASLKWDPPSQGTPTGYKVHYGRSSSAPTTTVNVGTATQYNLDNAPLAGNRTYYFWVSAYNSNGESPKAGPIPYKLGRFNPGLLPLLLK